MEFDEEFTIQEFFEIYVQNSGVQLPDVIDEETLHRLCTNFLSFSRLGPKDAAIAYEEEDSDDDKEDDDDYEGPQGYVLVSLRGLRLIDNFLQMKRVGNASIAIQGAFRRFKARRSVNLLVDAVMNHEIHDSLSDSSLSEEEEEVGEEVHEGKSILLTYQAQTMGNYQRSK